jgi:hypothetical protein
MRRLTSTLLLLLVIGFAAHTLAQQFRGQVVNRDGVPQRCQVEFFIGNDLQLRVFTDDQGYFYVNNPKWGGYRVSVTQGPNRNDIDVSIDQYGLHPSTLVVRW